MANRLATVTLPLALIAALFVLPSAARAEGMRCGTKLVHEGDTRTEVIAKCGEPTDVTRTSVMRRPVVWLHGRPYYASADLVEIPIERWVYNLGPQRFMREVRFEDGRVVDVATLGYGYTTP